MKRHRTGSVYTARIRLLVMMSLWHTLRQTENQTVEHSLTLSSVRCTYQAAGIAMIWPMGYRSWTVLGVCLSMLPATKIGSWRRWTAWKFSRNGWPNNRICGTLLSRISLYQVRDLRICYKRFMWIKFNFVWTGTHCSGCYPNRFTGRSLLVRKFGYTQNFDVWTQLVMGVRYLDISVG